MRPQMRRAYAFILSVIKSLADTSASNFIINSAGLTLTSPNGGESWLLNTPHTIRWTRNNAPGNVTVQFMRTYSTGTWEQLANNVAVDTFSWTPTGTASANVRTRIYLTTQTSCWRYIERKLRVGKSVHCGYGTERRRTVAYRFTASRSLYAHICLWERERSTESQQRHRRVGNTDNDLLQSIRLTWTVTGAQLRLP